MLELGNGTAEQVTHDSTTPVALQYASARERLPWGPYLFRPSLAAVILSAVTTLGATWLTLRHQPWREVARVPSSGAVAQPFTSDGLLITLDMEHGANLWDPHTGRLVRKVLKKIEGPNTQYFVVKGGEEILAASRDERTAAFYDGRNGRVLRRVPNPLFEEGGNAQVYPDGTRMITFGFRRNRRSASDGGGAPHPFSPLYVWDLKAAQPTAPLKPVDSIHTDSPLLQLSPSGHRMLSQWELGKQRGYELIDAKSLKVIHRSSMGSAGFVNDDLFHVDLPPPTTAPRALLYVRQIRDADDGKLLGEVPVPLRPGWAGAIVQTSADGRFILARFGTRLAGRVGGFPPTPATLYVIDAGSGEVVHTREAGFTHAYFLPRSSRYVTTDPATLKLALYDPFHAQPLAILDGACLPARRGHPQFSPDGRTMLLRVPDSDILASIHRPTGWDCPESHLGALAFPQTWLTAGSLIACCVWLRADAARRGRTLGHSPRGLARVAFAVTLPIAAYALICACLGDHRHARWFAPAAMLIVASIGLALGSRFWRLASLCAFAATLPYVLFVAYRVWGAGPKNSTPYPLLDRHYDVPHLPVLIALTCAAALLAFLLVTLARSTRHSAA